MLTTIIEKYLQAVDQATFQKMMNHLLHLEGYKFFGSPGSVIGKNKTSKGTPDSFFEDGENFAFCEFTTQERLEGKESFFQKLEKDVDHCFDTAKTGIPKSKITTVILGFTEKLTPSQVATLKSRVQTHNSTAQLKLYSIQEIPFRILYYPGFAEKYITGVKTTNGTLYTLPDFLKTTEKGLQPSLINDFTGREDEIEMAENYLANADLLILTGFQGVGKSKLAVHLLGHLEKQGFEPRVIASSPVPLWDDLQNFLHPGHKYAIVFDDANKALPNLDYLLHFMNQREDGSIKVIITVRDYVRHELNRLILDKHFFELHINPLEEDKLRDIIRNAWPGGQHLPPALFEKIVGLANGNPRLALMAIKSIQQPAPSNFLENVAALYDQYFNKIATEISFLKEPNKLRALGILSFFNVMDRQDNQLKDTLEKEFGINWSELWETFILLEQSELIDLFANETAKISDQVLNTYAFYKTFFDEKTALIPYEKWVLTFLKNYPSKVRKSLIDSINTFGFTELRNTVNSFLIKVQPHLASSEDLSYEFYSCFWFYKEVDTLLFIRNWVNGLEEEVAEVEELNFSFKNQNLGYKPPIIDLLLNFWEHDTPFLEEALKLGLTLLFKQPQSLPPLLKELKEKLSFKHHDYYNGYHKQHTLFKFLTDKTYGSPKQEMVDQIFLSIAGIFLSWQYHQFRSSSDSSFMVYNFNLVKTTALMDLRKTILTRIFDLLSTCPKESLAALNNYTWSGPGFDISVLADEQQWFSQMLASNLSPGNFTHAKIIKDYVDRLKREKISITQDWSAFLNTDLMKTAELFTFNLTDEEERLSIQEAEQKKRQRLSELVKGKDFGFIVNLLSEVQKLYVTDDTHYPETALGYLFNALADENIDLYKQVIAHILTTQYKFKYSYNTIIYYPLKKKLLDKEEFYRLINQCEYPHKQHWKKIFFEALDELEVNEFLFFEFVSFLNSLNEPISLYSVKEYYKFESAYQAYKEKLPPIADHHGNVITYIVTILMNKTNDITVNFGYDFCTDCKEFFVSNPELLKKVYFYQDSVIHHYDFASKEMKAVAELDENFVLDYIKKRSKDSDFLTFRTDDLKLSFIWDLPNYEAIADGIMEAIIQKSPLFSDFEHPANVLFNALHTDEPKTKALAYISRFIQLYHDQVQHSAIIMNVVVYSFNDHVLRFLRELLMLNKNSELLDLLFLYKNEVITGSWVPELDHRQKFYEQILDMAKTLPNQLDYAEHIKRWEAEIDYLKKRKQDELKRDFRGWQG
jgi:hypothetical protein